MTTPGSSKPKQRFLPTPSSRVCEVHYIDYTDEALLSRRHAWTDSLMAAKLTGNEWHISVYLDYLTAIENILVQRGLLEPYDGED